MGLFKKSPASQARASSAAVSIIAEGSRFKGELEIPGKLHIDGEVDGTVRCHNSVTVGKKGIARGHIITERLHVSGLVDGDVSCVSLHIDNSGTVKGRVSSDTMCIAERGNFVGERVLRDSGSVKALDTNQTQADSSANPEQYEA